MQTSVVNYKDLNFEFRIDAEYYRAEILKNIRLFDKKDNVVLSDLASFVIGPFGSTVTVDQYVPSSNFRYVRNKDINDFQISDDEQAYIPEQVYMALPRFHIKENDLLITVVGTLGKVAIATKKDVSSIFSCKSTIIRAKKIDPFYLLVYLNSNVGQLFALRGIRGAIQQGLNLSDLKEIKIFLPSENFQKSIRVIVSKAFISTTEAENLYVQAEQVLLSELNLLNWEPKHRLSVVKNFSEIQNADRIDAEYFQPMYEEVVDRIKQYKKGHVPLVKIIRTKDRKFQPKDDVTYRYIELANISTNGNINGFIEALGKELPTRARSKVNTGDVIVSTIEGSLSSIALITDDLDNALCSTGFFVINSERINSETLLVLLKSLVGQLQLKKRCSGTILTAIGDDEFKRIILPDLPANIQSDIKKKIIEMYTAKALSRRLLDIAKHGVELAIEKDEQDAEKWINIEVKKLRMTFK
jgi:restriction endonuclease S subunit